MITIQINDIYKIKKIDGKIVYYKQHKNKYPDYQLKKDILIIRKDDKLIYKGGHINGKRHGKVKMNGYDVTYDRGTIRSVNGWSRRSGKPLVLDGNRYMGRYTSDIEAYISFGNDSAWEIYDKGKLIKFLGFPVPDKITENWVNRVGLFIAKQVVQIIGIPKFLTMGHATKLRKDMYKLFDIICTYYCGDWFITDDDNDATTARWNLCGFYEEKIDVCKIIQ